MIAAIAADAVLLLHALFIVFAVLGAALLWRWPRLVWLHGPALAWAAFVEFSGRICPLTPLENHWREAAGQQGYRGGFIEHYLLPLIYPAGLTRELQWTLGAALLLINLGLYGAWLRSRSRRARD